MVPVACVRTEIFPGIQKGICHFATSKLYLDLCVAENMAINSILDTKYVFLLIAVLPVLPVFRRCGVVDKAPIG